MTKRQKDKQRSTKHSYKTTDRTTRTPLKTGGGVNSDAPGGYAVPVSLVAAVVLNEKNIALSEHRKRGKIDILNIHIHDHSLF